MRDEAQDALSAELERFKTALQAAFTESLKAGEYDAPCGSPDGMDWLLAKVRDELARLQDAGLWPYTRLGARLVPDPPGLDGVKARQKRKASRWAQPIEIYAWTEHVDVTVTVET